MIGLARGRRLAAGSAWSAAALSVAGLAPGGPSAPGVEAPPTATRLGLGLLGVRVDQLQQKRPRAPPGHVGLLLPFEIVSVHLLGGAGRGRLSGPAEEAGRQADAAGERRAMNLLTQPVGVSHYLVVGAVLFVTGAVSWPPSGTPWAC